MAEQQDRRLRGGTEGGELARATGAGLNEAGTADRAAPSGGVHVEPPSRHVPRTGLEGRPLEGTPRLAGGKTPEQVLGYLGGAGFPAKKDALIRAASQAGAPEDVKEALRLLPATEYGSADDLLRDYPRLPDEDSVEPNKGKT